MCEVGTEVEGVEAEVVLVGVEMEEGLSPVPSIYRYVYFLLGW